MRIIVYKCDHCGKVLSENESGTPHLSFTFDECSGWVAKDGALWRHVQKTRGIKQFCGGLCLGRYFSNLKPAFRVSQEDKAIAARLEAGTKIHYAKRK